jgi:protein involved in polysaccharide export with SLBB domain
MTRNKTIFKHPTPILSVLLAASLLSGLSQAQVASVVAAAGTAGTATPMAIPATPNIGPATLNAARTGGTSNLGDVSTSSIRPEKTNFNTPSAALPPLGTNQFASFVQETTGRTVPLYGYNLFGSNSFSSLADVPVPANYVLGPGDEINLKIWGATDASLNLAIDRNGQIMIPKVGPITVAGTRADQIEPLLKTHVGRTFTNVELSATLGRLRSIQVFVVGQARKPGVYTVSSLSTLISALFESGGPTASGSMRSIQLVRSGKTISTIDLYKFIHHGDTGADARLLPGDVIVIPPSGPRVALIGAMDNPAIFELVGKEEPLSQLLAYSGGQQVLTTSHKVLFERINPSQGKAPRLIEERNLTPEGLTTKVKDGDVITLFKISPEFSNAVTLRGNVAAPLRYAYRPGMKVSDLIPEPSALIQGDYYARKNILVQYESGGEISVDRVFREVKNILKEINWDYASIERIDTNEVRTMLIPFKLAKAVRDKDPANDMTLLPGDLVTIYSTSDLSVPLAKRNTLVRITGEVAAPGIYQALPGETLPQLIKRIGGLTPEAYLFGTELNRESVRVRQQVNLDLLLRKFEAQAQSQSSALAANLGATNPAQSQAMLQQQQAQTQLQLDKMRLLKSNGRIALELDPLAQAISSLPAVALEDGDTILIPSVPSFVSAVGSVNNDNVSIYRPGKTVADVLRSAGLAEDAEPEQAFVLRADGSVIARRDHSGLFGGNFDSLAIMPGDTVVMPAKIDRESRYTTVVRGFKDWTQILSNLGLGIASLATISKL